MSEIPVVGALINKYITEPKTKNRTQRILDAYTYQEAGTQVRLPHEWVADLCYEYDRKHYPENEQTRRWYDTNLGQSLRSIHDPEVDAGDPGSLRLALSLFSVAVYSNAGETASLLQSFRALARDMSSLTVLVPPPATLPPADLTRLVTFESYVGDTFTATLGTLEMELTDASANLVLLTAYHNRDTSLLEQDLAPQHAALIASIKAKFPGKRLFASGDDTAVLTSCIGDWHRSHIEAFLPGTWMASGPPGSLILPQPYPAELARVLSASWQVRWDLPTIDIEVKLLEGDYLMTIRDLTREDRYMSMRFCFREDSVIHLLDLDTRWNFDAEGLRTQSVAQSFLLELVYQGWPNHQLLADLSDVNVAAMLTVWSVFTGRTPPPTANGLFTYPDSTRCLLWEDL